MPTVLGFRLPPKGAAATRAKASRDRALERLYARQAAIHELIGALERYQEAGSQNWNAVMAMARGRRTGTAALRRRRKSLASA